DPLLPPPVAGPAQEPVPDRAQLQVVIGATLPFAAADLADGARVVRRRGRMAAITGPAVAGPHPCRRRGLVAGRRAARHTYIPLRRRAPAAAPAPGAPVTRSRVGDPLSDFGSRPRQRPARRP